MYQRKRVHLSASNDSEVLLRAGRAFACARLWGVSPAFKTRKRVLTQTDLHDKLREKIRARLKTFRIKANDERPKLEKALAKLDAEVARLVRFIRSTDPATNPGAFEAVKTSLDKTMVERRDLKAKLDALTTSTVEPRLPTEDEILAYVVDESFANYRLRLLNACA